MQYVYIVNQGEYSDRHVEAVFSSREQAELFIATHRDEERDEYDYCQYYTIEEFAVDEIKLEGKVYYAIVGYVVDNKWNIESYTTSLKPIKAQLQEERERDFYGRYFTVPVPDAVSYKEDGWHLNITERNKKVVSDTLAQLKAEQEGI